MDTSWDTACLRNLPALRLLAALWGGLAVVDVLVSLGAPVAVGTLGCALLVVACSWRASVGAALLVAGVVWLLVTGFVVNQAGQLRLEGPGDLVRLLALAVVAGLTSRASRHVPRSASVVRPASHRSRQGAVLHPVSPR